MSRLFKAVALAMLVMAVTASGAMAAASMSNTSRVIDYKMMNSDSWLVSGTTMTNAGVVMGYTVGTTLASGVTFKLVLTNATWGDSNIIYMGGATTSDVASCTPVAGDRTCTMTVAGATKTMVAGLRYLVASNIGASSLPPIRVKTGLLPTETVTLGVEDVSGTFAVATATAFLTADANKTLTVAATDDSTANARVIDAANSRKTFVVGAGGASNKLSKVSFAWTNTALIDGTTSSLIGANSGLAGFKATLAITGDFTGVSGVAWGTNATTTINIPSGQGTLTLANQAGNTLGDLIFQVNGTTSLNPRTFTLSVTSPNQAERGDAMPLTPATTGNMNHVWTTNGYSTIVPGLVYDSTGAYVTSCTINNPTATASAVDVDVLNAYTGSGSVAYYPGVVTLPAAGTARLVFGSAGDKNIKAYLWSGGAEGTPAVTALSTSIGAWDRFSVKITLPALTATGGATISCVQRDGVDRNRAIPTLTLDPLGTQPPRQ